MGSFNHVLGLILYYTLASLAALLISPVIAVSVNITVDDTFGNNTFPPMTLDQSWHYAVYDSDAGTPLQVHVTFPGTAVYVYNVLPNTLPTGAIDSNISFALDGETVGTFVRLPTSSSDFLYNQLVYANASLSDMVHTLVISAFGNEPSLIFFDYLLYTTEAALEGMSDSATATVTGTVTSSPAVTETSGTSASSVHPPTAAIAGGVAGGVALLLVGAALLYLVSSLLRRRHRQTLARPLAERTDFASEGATTSSMATLESVQPLHIGPLSNAATITGETLTGASSRPPESKREAELRCRNDNDALPVQAQPETDRLPPSQCRQRSESDISSESEELGLGTGTVHALHGEIAALRDVLQSTMTARAGLHDDFNLNEPAMSEVLPRYEELEARRDGLGMRDRDRRG